MVSFGMPRLRADEEKAEHASSVNPWTGASPPNTSHTADHDVHHTPNDSNCAEEFGKNPISQADVELQDCTMRVATANSRVEAYHNVKSPSPKPVLYHPFSVHVLSLLMSFSLFGTLSRLGIHALASYKGQSIFPLAWVQAAGCGISGLTWSLRDPITQFYGPLYIAITTGLCGSLTTFSGWQLDVFLAWADTSGTGRLWIYDIMDGLTRTLFTMAASLASFGFGVRLGMHIARRATILSPPRPIVRWIVTIVSVLLYLLTIPLFVWLDDSWRPLVTAALIFSFPGTLTRYVLSTYLNPRFQSLPFGTLLANEVATTFLAAFHVIQRAPSVPGPAACSILQGFMDGYCGCMSTVSTFVAELWTLKGRKTWSYFGVSYGLAQVILLSILGPAWWAGRIKESNLCSFN